jgi:hypothetical protein
VFLLKVYKPPYQSRLAAFRGIKAFSFCVFFFWIWLHSGAIDYARINMGYNLCMFCSRRFIAYNIKQYDKGVVEFIFHYALFGFIFPVLCFKKMQLQFDLKKPIIPCINLNVSAASNI